MVQGHKLTGNSQRRDCAGFGYRGSMVTDAGQRPPLPRLAKPCNCVSCTMCSNACSYEKGVTMRPGVYAVAMWLSMLVTAPVVAQSTPPTAPSLPGATATPKTAVPGQPGATTAPKTAVPGQPPAAAG